MSDTANSDDIPSEASELSKQERIENFTEEEDVDEAEKIESLKGRLQTIKVEHEEMEDRLMNAVAEKNEYELKYDRTRRENEKLKQSPLFIATVQDLTEDGVIVKQHGNNQEVLTEITDEKKEDLEPGDRVAINNSLSIAEVLDSETSAHAQAMEVDESPDVGYSDIGGIDPQLEEVRETVEMPLEEPEAFEEIGIEPPSGVLLYGPPGTGKTMLAKAVANQTDATFIKMAGSELVHKFIGEGSKLVRGLFEEAQENEPTVLFIDEIDAIAAKRTDSKTSGDAEVQRTMMQLLSELDGFEDRGDVRVIAATNRVDMLDEAILRPGRFDRLIEVPEPDGAGRKQIFEIHTERMNIADGVDFEELADLSEGASGAEIEAICTEAGMFAIRNSRTEVTMGDFVEAYEKTIGSRAEDEPVAEPIAFA